MLHEVQGAAENASCAGKRAVIHSRDRRSVSITSAGSVSRMAGSSLGVSL
jgi:hypothetical protein